MATVIAVALCASIYASPFVGSIADIVSKRTVILWGNFMLASCALALAYIASINGKDLWLIYLILLISGSLDAVVTITQQALIRDIAEDSKLLQANAYSALLQNAPLILGPGIGAALYLLIDFKYIGLLDAASFILAGLSTLVLNKFQAQKRNSKWLRVPFQGATIGLKTLFACPPMRVSQLLYSLSNIGNGIGAGVLTAYILYGAANPQIALGAFGVASALGMAAAAYLLVILKLPGSYTDNFRTFNCCHIWAYAYFIDKCCCFDCSFCIYTSICFRNFSCSVVGNMATGCA